MLNKERAQSIFLFIAGRIPLYTKILLITPNPKSKYFILMRLLFHNKWDLAHICRGICKMVLILECSIKLKNEEVL